MTKQQNNLSEIIAALLTSKENIVINGNVNITIGGTTVNGDMITGNKVTQNGKINVNGDNNIVKKAKCRKHRGKGSKKAEAQSTVVATQVTTDETAAPKYWLTKPKYACDLLLACRSKIIDGKVAAVAVMKDRKSGSIANSELTLEAEGAFQLAPYFHVLENAEIGNTSICMDMFDFVTKENLDRIYKAASAKGIKIFGMTKTIKEDDSADIADMKKSLAAISNTAKEALDSIGIKTKTEEIAPAVEESSPAPVPEVSPANMADKLSSLLPNKEEAVAAKPAEEPILKSEEDMFDGMDL